MNLNKYADFLCSHGISEYDISYAMNNNSLSLNEKAVVLTELSLTLLGPITTIKHLSTYRKNTKLRKLSKEILSKLNISRYDVQ